MNGDLAKTKKPDPLRQIVTWIIAGHTEPDIRDALAEQFPDAKAKPLIIAAMKEIARSSAPDHDIVRGFAIEGTRAIYQKALEIADHQTALRALKQLVELTKR